MKSKIFTKEELKTTYTYLTTERIIYRKAYTHLHWYHAVSEIPEYQTNFGVFKQKIEGKNVLTLETSKSASKPAADMMSADITIVATMEDEDIYDESVLETRNTKYGIRINVTKVRGEISIKGRRVLATSSSWTDKKSMNKIGLFNLFEIVKHGNNFDSGDCGEVMLAYKVRRSDKESVETVCKNPNGTIWCMPIAEFERQQNELMETSEVQERSSFRAPPPPKTVSNYGLKKLSGRYALGEENCIEDIKGIEDYLNISDYMKDLKYQEENNKWFSEVECEDSMIYWLSLSDKVYKYLTMTNQPSKSFKIAYGNGFDMDMDNCISALSVEIVMLDEDTSIDFNIKSSADFKQKMKNYTQHSKGGDPYEGFRFGGLEGEEAYIAKWNCD